MKPAAFLAAFLLLASTALAQITAPERIDEHTVAALKVDRAFPSGSKVKYRWSAPTLSIGEGTSDNKTAYVTGPVGSHSYEAIVAWIEGDALQLEKYSGTLIVGKAPPVPPVVVKTLAELAGDKAAILAELITDLRQAGLPIAPSVDALKRGLGAGLARAGVAANHPAVVEINKRIDAAASGSLTDASRQSLDAALAAIASELGAKPPEPPKPPVVEGKRRVVIISEIDDQSAALGAMKVATANDSAAAKYFRDHGHIVQFLEEEQLDSAGNPHPFVKQLTALGVGVPAVHILDLSTNAVISSEKLREDATADNLVELVKKTGG